MKRTKKLIAALLAGILVSTHLLALGSEVIAVAEELQNQNNQTNHNNVEINACFQDGSYIKDIQINEQASLNLEFEVKDSGYLKNGIVNILDGNYKFNSTNLNNENVQSITENQIAIKQLNSNNGKVSIEVPIIINSAENISMDYLYKQTQIQFTGTYINADGKENKIEKDIYTQAIWKTEAEIEATAQITKFTPYQIGENYGMILQAKINSKIKDNSLPVQSINITTDLPQMQVNEEIVKPTKVTVIANTTEATNGKTSGIQFTEANYSYNAENNQITIQVQNAEENGQVSWAKGAQDEYIITYIYEGKEIYDFANQSINSIQPQSGTINYDIKYKLYDEAQSEIQNTIQTKYTLQEASEFINEYEINYTPEISKGHLYANIIKDQKQAKGEQTEEKQETEYQLIYRAQIINKDLVENISFTSTAEKFIGNANYSAETYVKTILIPESIFNKMLGEEGKIEIFKQDNTKISEITKETAKDENGNHVIDISNANASDITIKTTAPVTEGEFAIKLTKALQAEQNIIQQQIKTLTQMTVAVEIHTNEEKILEGIITLKEPITKAELVIDESEKTLSTITENKNVEFKVVLDTLNTNYALWKNPILEIEMPTSIQKVTLNSVNLLLDDELKIKEQKVVNKNGKQIIQIILEGTQSKYFNKIQAENQQNVIAKGANIVINANLQVKPLTPSKTEKITLYYKNENTNNATSLALLNENENIGMATATVDVVAPTGMATATIVTGHNGAEEVTNITDDKKQIKIPTYSETKKVTVTGTIINNYTNSLGNVSVLGRLPFEGNKKIDSTETLGSTFTAKLLNAITVNGIDSSKVKIYYSANEDVTNNVADTASGWSDTLTDFSNVKNYLIVIDETTEILAAEQITFTYELEIPQNLAHNEYSSQMYKVYYTNKAEGAELQEEKTAGIIEFTTGEGPELEVSIDTNLTTTTLDLLGETKEYYTAYESLMNRVSVNIKNTSNVEAENVKVQINIPECIILYYYDENSLNYEKLENPISIGSIAAGESKLTEFVTKVEIPYEDNEEDDNHNYYYTELEMNTSITADNMENSLSSDKVTFIIVPSSFNKFINKTNTSENEIYSQLSKIQYEIETATVQTLNNFKLVIPIPVDISIKNAYWKNGKEKIEEGITRGQNEIVASIDSLEVGDYTFILEFEIGENTDSKFSTKVYVEADNIERQYSDERYIYAGKASLKGEQLNTNKKYVKENEEFQYQFTINTLEKGTHHNFVFEDQLPDGVILQNAKVEINCLEGLDYSNTQNILYKDGKVTISIPVLPAQSEVIIKLNVKAMLNSKDEDGKEIVNKATIKSNEASLVEVNSVTNFVEYDAKAHININTGKIEGEDGSQTEGNNPTETRYKITGKAWEDTNKNGKQDENEKYLSGINVMLIYKSNNQIVTDEDNKQQKILTTDSNGNYEFTNLTTSEYLVVFLYDAGKYNITTYQEKGIGASYNSDAISMNITLEGKKQSAGVTDIIKVIDGNVRDIDLGLYISEKFDLKLDKYISKITLTTPTIGTKVYNYDNSNLEKIEVLNKNVGKSNIVVEYKIVITNEGQVPGYATKIIDYLPENMKFNSELNSNWYVADNNRTVYNTQLAETKIQPGEKKELKLILSLGITEKNIGTIVNNNAEIYESYNELGLEDFDSTEANMLTTEDDMSYANIVLSVVTGKIVMYSTLGATILAILIIGIYEIKKRVLNKNN